MAIFQGSRYTFTNIYDREGVATFKRRVPEEFNKVFKYEYSINDRLDNLALKVYGDPQLWWIILDANVGYRYPTDIQPGDIINIPYPEEVGKYAE